MLCNGGGGVRFKIIREVVYTNDFKHLIFDTRLIV
jgi:hypothetical protein